MPNDINSTSPSIRDFLLNRNLILADSITKNGLSGVAVGLGQVSSIDSFPVAVQASKDIEVSSIDYRESLIKKNAYISTDDYILTDIITQSDGGSLPPGKPSVEYGSYIGSETENSKFNNYSNETRLAQTSKNRYISQDQMVSATIINNSFAYKQQDGGYIDENNNLNIGGPSTEAYDILGSIISQNGLGLSSNGFTSQFDIRSSLAGRVLGATGAINDTPIGIIGGQQMLLALGQRATFNVQKEISGKVNLQPFSLLKGADLINPDWTITVKGTLGGKIFDSALNLAGFEVPKSVIDNGASIFQDDAGYLGDSSKIGSLVNQTHPINSSSVGRNNALIKNTGKGQLIRLFDLLNRNKYKPDYKSSGSSKIGIIDAQSYARTPNDLIDFTDSERYSEDIDASPWDGGVGNPLDSDTSLIANTKRMFNKNADLVTVLFNKQGSIGPGDRQLNTPSGGRLSKGSGVVSSEYLSNSSTANVFCRTWTSNDRYDNVSSLQKNSGLFGYKDKIRNGIDDSVLGRNGFVKITPYEYTSTYQKRDEVQKYMFSIENLAWNDKLSFLPSNEIGNGDLTTGTKGRVMWFPPYGIKFSDTTAVNWDTTDFIGRGEPIYTYNNTERSGTLEFQIIIDYPDYLNNTALKTDELLSSIAAGCTDYDDYFSPQELNDIKSDINQAIIIKKTKDIGQPKPVNFNIYFPNDSAIMLENYEIGTGLITQTISEGKYNDKEPRTYENREDYSLNKVWDNQEFLDSLKEKLSKESNAYNIEILGYASKDGTTGDNKKLSDARAQTVYKWVIDNLGYEADADFTSRVKIVDGVGEKGTIIGDIDSLKKKKARFVSVSFVYAPKDNTETSEAVDVDTEPTNETKAFVSNITRRFHREDTYFKELIKSDNESDKIIYNNIREKVKFFQPGFHSITPEGFNSRLTFLQQCTRQGPTDNEKGASNLAFGMAPVCILRIGDFYHTKIIMNTLAITYDPLVWDLNPEGVGVQPMIANVSIAFKFIGGSSLNGPINRLQNAVSFNYFANTGVYDPRADKIAKTKPSDNDSPAEYKIIDGVELLDRGISLVSQPLASIPTTSINQIKTAEVQLRKPLEAVASNDKTEIEKIVVASNPPYLDGNDYIILDFKYKPSLNSTFTLTKEYKGNVYLKSTKENNLSIKLGSITAKNNSSNSIIINANGDLTNSVILDENATFDFSFIFGDLSKKATSKLLEMKEKGGGSIQLEWETGAKNIINLT
jgi:hypothetical protein